MDDGGKRRKLLVGVGGIEAGSGEESFIKFRCKWN